MLFLNNVLAINPSATNGNQKLKFKIRLSFYDYMLL